jgi:hypothetical protein
MVALLANDQALAITEFQTRLSGSSLPGVQSGLAYVLGRETRRTPVQNSRAECSYRKGGLTESALSIGSARTS